MHSHKGYSVLLGLIIHTFFWTVLPSPLVPGYRMLWAGLFFFLSFCIRFREGFHGKFGDAASGRSRGTAWGDQ